MRWIVDVGCGGVGVMTFRDSRRWHCQWKRKAAPQARALSRFKVTTFQGSNPGSAIVPLQHPNTVQYHFRASESFANAGRTILFGRGHPPTFFSLDWGTANSRSRWSQIHRLRLYPWRPAGRVCMESPLICCGVPLAELDEIRAQPQNI